MAAAMLGTQIAGGLGEPNKGNLLSVLPPAFRLGDFPIDMETLQARAAEDPTILHNFCSELNTAAAIFNDIHSLVKKSHQVRSRRNSRRNSLSFYADEEWESSAANDSPMSADSAGFSLWETRGPALLATGHPSQAAYLNEPLPSKPGGQGPQMGAFGSYNLLMGPESNPASDACAFQSQVHDVCNMDVYKRLHPTKQQHELNLALSNCQPLMGNVGRRISNDDLQQVRDVDLHSFMGGYQRSSPPPAFDHLLASALPMPVDGHLQPTIEKQWEQYVENCLHDEIPSSGSEEDCTFSCLSEKPRQLSSTTQLLHANQPDNEASMMPSNRLFVGNLGWWVDEKELSDWFGKYGSIKSVKVMWNARKMHKAFDKWRSREYGFVEFHTTEEATKALIWMNGVNYPGFSKDENGLVVQYARPV